MQDSAAEEAGAATDTGSRPGSGTRAEAAGNGVPEAPDIAIVVTKCSDGDGGSSPDGGKTKVLHPSQESGESGVEDNNLQGNNTAGGSGMQVGTGETNQDEEAAPFNTILDFLSSLLTKNYKEALRLSKNILKYEPHNKTVAEFLNVLEEVVAGGLLEDTDSSGSSSASSSESDSSGSSASSSSASSDSDSSDSEFDGDTTEFGMGTPHHHRHHHRKHNALEDLESILTATTCSCKKGRHHHLRHQGRNCSSRRINSANTICTTLTNISCESSSSMGGAASTCTGASSTTNCGRALLRDVESRLNSAGLQRCLLGNDPKAADAEMRRALWAMAEASTVDSVMCMDDKYHHPHPGMGNGPAPPHMRGDWNDCVSMSAVSTPDTFTLPPPPLGACYLSSRDGSASSSTTDCCTSILHQTPVHPDHPIHAFRAAHIPLEILPLPPQSHLPAHHHAQHPSEFMDLSSDAGSRISKDSSSRKCKSFQIIAHPRPMSSLSGHSGHSTECFTPPATPASPLKSILKNPMNCKYKPYQEEVRFHDSLLPCTPSSSSSGSISGETTDDGYSS